MHAAPFAAFAANSGEAHERSLILARLWSHQPSSPFSEPTFEP